MPVLQLVSLLPAGLLPNMGPSPYVQLLGVR